MKITSFPVHEKLSVSLSSLIERKSHNMKASHTSRMAGFLSSNTTEAIREIDPVAVIIETSDVDEVLKVASKVSRSTDKISVLNNGFVSARASLDTIHQLAVLPVVNHIQSKKENQQSLDHALPEIGLLSPFTGVGGGTRQVVEDGKDVLIGVVDSGFDLSHPAFYDANGQLRVERLLDQSNNTEYDTAQLQNLWSNGSGPGIDENGHGTHVSSIAGGTRFHNYEGVAPNARFLLVKTDFINVDEGVKWIFQQAGTRPCVINLSLGNHFGAHDGTDAAERLYTSLTAPGKLIVVAAGNEREGRIHIGSNFHFGQTEEIKFNILPTNDPRKLPGVVLTLWHYNKDIFDFTLLTPDGTSIGLPPLGRQQTYQSSLMEIDIAYRPYTRSQLIQTQITISFLTNSIRSLANFGFKLRSTCTKAVVGRLDGWFQNSGFALFENHPLVETSRTVGLPGTSKGVITVASYITSNEWVSDAGNQNDVRAVLGRSSPFSSMGPTRDGRNKPEIAAPGQYITAALADRSELAGWTERSVNATRIVTIEGTSMATPVITGVIALMLQKKNNLTLSDALGILKASARHDVFTGLSDWNPTYGFGKIDVAKALSLT